MLARLIRLIGFARNREHSFDRRITALETAVAQLQTEELERERAVAEQIEQLKRFWKRLRTRDSREALSEDPQDDLFAFQVSRRERIKRQLASGDTP